MVKLQGKYMSKLKCSSFCIDNSLTHYVSFELPGETSIAYGQLTSWCCGWLGSNVRVIFPSCAVMTIKRKFPSSANT